MRSPLAAVRRFLADEPYRRMPDDELWARFRDHADGDSLRVILEKVGGRLSARCRAVTGDPALAEDALQDTLLQLVRHRRRIGTYGQAVAWLYRVADSRSRMLMRSRRRAWWRDWRAARPEAVPDAEPTEFEAVAVAVARLPPRERRAVELVYLEGMTHDETAAALGLSRGSVGTYVNRGVKRLRGRLGPAGLAGALVTGSLPPGQAAALATTALVRGTVVRWLPAKLAAAVAGLGVLVGGAGWVATRNLMPPAERPPVLPERLTERNLRLFDAEVRAGLLQALQPLALADGEVRLERVRAYDTRVDATLTVRHGPAGGPVSRVRMLADTDTRHTQAFLDAASRGRSERLLQPTAGRPTVVLRPWAGGPRLELPVPALTAAVEAFDRLPGGGEAAVEGVRFRTALAAELADRRGGWRHHGDPREVWRLSWEPGDDRPRLAAPPGHGWSLADGRTWYRIEPDGPLGSRLLFEDEPVEFAGGRLTFTRTGEWWDRDGD